MVGYFYKLKASLWSRTYNSLEMLEMCFKHFLNLWKKKVTAAGQRFNCLLKSAFVSKVWTINFHTWLHTHTQPAIMKWEKFHNKVEKNFKISFRGVSSLVAHTLVGNTTGKKLCPFVCCTTSNVWEFYQIFLVFLLLKWIFLVFFW